MNGATDSRLAANPYHERLSSNTSNLWHIPEPPPTTLIVGWPGDEPPDRATILGRLDLEAGRPCEVDFDQEPEPDALWTIQAVMAPGAAPLIAWAHPALPIPAPEQLDSRGIPRPRFVLVMQTPHDGSDPHAWYARLLRLARRMAPELTFLMDYSSGAMWSRDELDGMVRAPILPEGTAFTTASWPSEPDEFALCWVFTRGRARFGRPELELLEVPGGLVRSAVRFLMALSERFLDEPMPEPGEPCLVAYAHGCRARHVVFQPWQVAGRYLRNTSPGQPAQREQLAVGEGADVAATVCASEPRGAYRKAWVPPLEFLQEIKESEPLMLVSEQSLQRRTRLARWSWPEFAAAFRDISSLAPPLRDQIAVRVTARLPQVQAADADNHFEHVLMDVLSIDGDQGTGRILQRPFWSDHRKGEIIGFSINTIADWQVTLPSGTYHTDVWALVRRVIASLAK